MSNFDDFVDGPIRRGDVQEAVRMWRREYARARQRGWTALHCACYNTGGDSQGIVRVLLDHGCDIEGESDEYGMIGLGGWSRGWRPLHLCASYGNRGAMQVLLDAGCCLTARSAGGETPLQIAKERNHHECASMLMAAMQIGKTLLNKLLDGDGQEVTEEIKDKPVDEQEIEEWRNMKVDQVDLRSLRLRHECLVYRCIHQKNVDEVYSLCTSDIVNSESLFMGPTALETAVNCKAVVWVHEILKKLVTVDESWVRAEGIAREKNLSRISELISKRREYLNRKEKKGLSRLHVAVIENDPDIVNYLLKNHIFSANASHKNFGTALSLAYNIDNMKCVQSLQANNVDVNTVDRFMQTPLHVAISNKTEDQCEYLVDNTRNMEDEDVVGGISVFVCLHM